MKEMNGLLILAHPSICAPPVDFFQSTRKPKVLNVTAANKAKIPVRVEGDILLQNSGTYGMPKVLLQNVLHVPNISSNLISVSAIAAKGYKVTFSKTICEVYNPEDNLVISGTLSKNNVYKLNLKSVNQDVTKATCAET